jgi:hypothetical protein
MGAGSTGAAARTGFGAEPGLRFAAEPCRVPLAEGAFGSLDASAAAAACGGACLGFGCVAGFAAFFGGVDFAADVFAGADFLEGARAGLFFDLLAAGTFTGPRHRLKSAAVVATLQGAAGNLLID